MKISENSYLILVMSLVAIICISATYFIVMTSNMHQKTYSYDCSMAEWHPDIPQAVKEQCRKRSQQK